MQADRGSFTASMIAVARGLGRVLPPDARLVEDPFGERFSTTRALDFARRHAAGFLFRWLEPTLLTVQVRTKLLDEALVGFVESGGAQVLLLGAGYDARASRLGALRGGARVFEVDHPATQREKRARLADPPHVTYLPWDFERDGSGALPAALARAGFDAGARSFVLWEGVTMYLTEPAVDATVRAVAAATAPGSTFVFTYLERRALRRPSLAARVLRVFVRGLGEPLTFGFDSAALPAWCEDRGFALAHDVSFQDAARVLLPERYRARALGDGFRVAFATRAA